MMRNHTLDLGALKVKAMYAVGVYVPREDLDVLINIVEAADRVAVSLTLGDYLDNAAQADEIGLLDLEAELGRLKG